MWNEVTRGQTKKVKSTTQDSQLSGHIIWELWRMFLFNKKQNQNKNLNKKPSFQTTNVEPGMKITKGKEAQSSFRTWGLALNTFLGQSRYLTFLSYLQDKDNNDNTIIICRHHLLIYTYMPGNALSTSYIPSFIQLPSPSPQMWLASLFPGRTREMNWFAQIYYQVVGPRCEFKFKFLIIPFQRVVVRIRFKIEEGKCLAKCQLLERAPYVAVCVPSSRPYSHPLARPVQGRGSKAQSSIANSQTFRDKNHWIAGQLTGRQMWRGGQEKTPNVAPSPSTYRTWHPRRGQKGVPWLCYGWGAHMLEKF